MLRSRLPEDRSMSATEEFEMPDGKPIRGPDDVYLSVPTRLGRITPA